jgi:hypothetical protein
MRTLSDIYGEQGEDWEEQLEQRGKEAAKAKEIAEKYGVDVALILAPPKMAAPQPPKLPPSAPAPKPANGRNGNGHLMLEPVAR